MNSRPVVLLFVCTMVFAGCSKDLTRSKAAQMIRAHAQFQEPLRIDCDNSFTISYRTNEVPDEKVMADVKPKAPCFTHFFDKGTSTYRITKRQITKGLLGLSDLRPEQYYWEYTAHFELTPKGRNESADWKSVENSWLIPIARKEFIEVTGIKADEILGTKRTVADFSWKWVPTDLGENPKLAQRAKLQTQSREGHAFFHIYDDGWRLMEIAF